VAKPCQIDFYVLEDESLSPDMLVCRLALMAWKQGNRVLILAEDQEHAKQLDTALWEKPEGRYLPHKLIQQPGSAPVNIGTQYELNDHAAEVLINLTGEAVSSPGRFQRLLELVPFDNAQREASRNKFRTYRNLGLKPESHSANQD